MSIIGLVGVIIALVVGYFSVTGEGGGLFGEGGGPIATGPGTSEVRDPQPVSRGGGGFFGTPPPPRPGSGQAPSGPAPAPKPGESPYKGQVRISTVHRSGDRPEQEYVIFRYSSGVFGFGGNAEAKPVDVTGWRIASLRSSEPIPRAFDIPEIDATDRDIVLPPGGELIIVIGTPSYQRNFRENQCVGYLTQSYSFTPSLSSSCRDSRPDRTELLLRGFNGACIDAINAVPTCRTPRGPYQAAIIGKACLDYLNENFSYVGCVENFRDQKDFLKNTWRVSLRRTTKLFDPRHDIVTLRDGQGLLVDEFEY